MLQMLVILGIFLQNAGWWHALEDELRSPERMPCPITKSFKVYLEWHPLTLGYLFLISTNGFREWSKCHNDVDIGATKVKVVAVSKSHN